MPPPRFPHWVRFEKAGRAGKAVTIVGGLTMHPEGKTTLLAALKKKLGVGGTVKNGQIELHGDQRDRLARLLPELLKQQPLPATQTPTSD